MVFVYVIKCQSSGKYYAGITTHPQRRVQEHNRGKSKFTSGYGPWVIIYCEEHADWEEARKREKYFKTGAGRRFIAKIEDGQV
jgi:predicted GIY-YIG superfamily endonuclease